jgi:hypothetical protein
MILPDCNDSAGEGAANEPQMFDYGTIDAAMSNAGRNWSQVEDSESDEDDPENEDIGMYEDQMEDEDEGIGPLGLHVSDELGECLEQALAAIGELVC